MKKQKEILKPVVGYEEFYKVTNTGKVWSNSRKRFLKPVIDKYGYVYFQLCNKTGHYKTCKLHRLVYEAFRGPLQPGYDVNHVDENKQNNNINNLVAMAHGQHVRYHKLGFKHTDETKRKISISRKKAWAKKKFQNNFYVLIQVDENNYALSGIPKN